MRSIKYFTLLLCLFIFSNSFSQSQVFEDLNSFQLRNMGEIKEKNQVTGYYLFQKLDKLKNSKNLFRLSVLNSDLKLLATDDFEQSRNLTLSEVAYNGKNILAKFVDVRAKKYLFKMYGSDGKLKYEIERELEKFEIQIMEQNKNESGEMFSSTLINVGDIGFIDYHFVKVRALSYTYVSTFFGNSKDKNWTFETNSKKGFDMPYPLIATSDVIVYNVIRREKTLSRDMDHYIVTIDSKTGKLLSETQTNAGPVRSLLLCANLDSDNNIKLYGQYFSKEDNAFADTSLGFISYNVSNKGELENMKKVKWKNIFPRLKKGEKEKLRNIYFHNFIEEEDGSISVIGELFGKKASALGIASVALGGRASVVDIKTGDLVLINISSDYSTMTSKRIEKNKETIYLPPGAGMLSAPYLGHYAKSMNYFSYKFTQNSIDDDLYIVCYLEDRKKGIGPFFKTFTNVEGELIEDSIDLDTDASRTYILNGKLGHVLMLQYFKKEKKLDMNLTAINF